MNIRALANLEIVRYGMISAVALGVDVLLLSLLVRVLQVHYLLAATASFIAGGVVAYFLSVRFVFRYHRLQQRTIEALGFVVLGCAGLALNAAVMALAVGGAGAPLLVGKLAAASVTFGVNYLLRKLILFTPWKSAAADPHST